MAKTSARFENAYRNLNKAQKEAVDAIEGPVLVVAGPGSGKTELLTVRTGNILKSTDARPSNILCLTFTESGALNMKRRLADLIGKDAYQVAVHTFHSFGVDVIEKYPEFFYGGASFYPADELVQFEVVEEILGNLRYDDSLASVHPTIGAVYLKPVKNAIEKLKKAGLTAEEFETIIEHNAHSFKTLDPEIEHAFGARVSKQTVSSARELLTHILERAKKERSFPVSYFKSLSFSLGESLKRAIDEAESSGNTTVLSEWKKAHTKKMDNSLRLKESVNHEKLKSLANIYKLYGEKMYTLGYYDFEDMLLEVIQAIKKYPTLRHELLEQYQYIEVDEFQDTNDAQMRLIYLLSEADVSEGRPNVCAVGDDDQAIYKFQGASLSNILDFRSHFRDPKLVVLKENYRSTQDILDVAQFFIRKGTERLETLVPELQKMLIASNKDLGKGDIRTKHFGTDLEEYAWVGKEIRRLIDEGENPKDVAVIARKHSKLLEFSKYLSAFSVPTLYERNQNVFDEAHVHQLVQMCRFSASLLGKNTDEADYLLPEILSYPFWQLSRKTLWDIAIRAERGQYTRQKWMDIMQKHEDEKVRAIAIFFLGVSRFSRHHTLLETLDLLIGEHTTFEEGAEESGVMRDRKKKKKRSLVESPFKKFYFNEKRFEENKIEYLTFLSALQVFVSSIREYRHGKPLSLPDLVRFVDRHEQFDLRVIDQSPYTASEEAISLLTAHKAKGLEFRIVFVLSCQEDIWAGRGDVKKIAFPTNLPIEPAGDTADDHLRLFFVALTRAREKLFMTSYERRSDGKLSMRLHFFDKDEIEEKNALPMQTKIKEFLQIEKEKENKNAIQSARMALFDTWQASHASIYIPDEKAMLTKMLEHYQMSATHLNNFLNIPEGGPKYFLEQSLLHFPQAKNPSMSYGTAMHSALEDLYKHFRHEGKLPPRKLFLQYFEGALLKERLNDADFKKYFDRGNDALSLYYEQKKMSFDSKDKIETNFKHEGVVVGDAHLSGKIDKMLFEGDRITVVDFKTGKIAKSWGGKDEIEKQKLFRYKNQLLFYKILVENSATFGGKYKVNEGILEFLEPKSGVFCELSDELSDDSSSELSRLIAIVYKKIISLDLPDTRHYSKDLKGILAFRKDLLEKKI